MRVKDFPNGTLTDVSRMLFDNEESGTHSVDMATLKQQFGGGGGSFGGSIYDFVDEMTKNGENLWLRRSVIRGESLGADFTDEQKAAIFDGSFTGIFLGDYWEDSRGIRQYTVLDFDYWYGGGVCLTSKHHVVLGSSMGGNVKFYDATYPISAYGNSKIIQYFRNNTFLPEKGPFSANDFVFVRAGEPMDMNDEGMPTEWDETGSVTVYGCVPNQHMIFGKDIVPRERPLSYVAYATYNHTQLALFQKINLGASENFLKKIGLGPLYGGIWLRDFFDKYTGITCNLTHTLNESPIISETYLTNTSTYAANPALAIFPIVGVEKTS